MKPPPGMKEVITDWYIEYQRRLGTVRSARETDQPVAVKLALPSHERILALAWLVTLILTPRARREHFALVDKIFPTRPVLAVPWRIVDPYSFRADTDPDTALPQRALDLAKAGPEQMTLEEIAFLLLDEGTLTNFSLLVRDLMPDWWLDALAEGGALVVSDTSALAESGAGGGVEELEREGDFDEVEECSAEMSELFAGKVVLDWGLAAPRSGSVVWEIKLDDAAQSRIALLAFGDASVKFELRLHRLSDNTAELEMTPPPLKADLAFPATFPTGDCCTFMIPVPAEAKSPGIAASKIRRTTRSEPCASLPAEAFAISGGELRSENGIDTIVFR
jgi:hypothetical protein